MDVTRIDQIAIVVEDLDAAIAHYQECFGLEVEYRVVVEKSQIDEAMINVNGVYLQLIQPLSPDSRTGRFLAEHGPGLHHLGFGVSSLDEAIEHLRDKGAEVSEPRLGGGGHHMIAFAEADERIGVLTELVDDADA